MKSMSGKAAASAPTATRRATGSAVGAAAGAVARASSAPARAWVSVSTAAYPSVGPLPPQADTMARGPRVCKSMRGYPHAPAYGRAPAMTEGAGPNVRPLERLPLVTRRGLVLFGAIAVLWCVLAWFVVSWIAQE